MFNEAMNFTTAPRLAVEMVVIAAINEDRNFKEPGFIALEILDRPDVAELSNRVYGWARRAEMANAYDIYDM